MATPARPSPRKLSTSRCLRGRRSAESGHQIHASHATAGRLEGRVATIGGKGQTIVVRGAVRQTTEVRARDIHRVEIGGTAPLARKADQRSIRRPRNVVVLGGIGADVSELGAVRAAHKNILLAI